MAGKTKNGESHDTGRENRQAAGKCTHSPRALQAAVLRGKEKIIQSHIFNDIYDWDPTAKAKVC